MPRKSDLEQSAPTAPRPTDRDGRTLDAWGLPLGGPARLRALEAAGKPDPNDDPAAWGRRATDAGTAGQQD